MRKVKRDTRRVLIRQDTFNIALMLQCTMILVLFLKQICYKKSPSCCNAARRALSDLVTRSVFDSDLPAVAEGVRGIGADYAYRFGEEMQFLQRVLHRLVMGMTFHIEVKA